MAGRYILMFFAVGGLSKEMFYFDEEFLVVCSFFLIFGALINLSSGVVAAELDSRIETLQSQIFNIYRLRIEILNSLVNSYKIRVLVHAGTISGILFSLILLRGRLSNIIESSSNHIIESFIRSLNESMELETTVTKEFFNKDVDQTAINDSSDQLFFDHCFVSLQAYSA